jgi:hypothetical protein
MLGWSRVVAWSLIALGRRRTTQLHLVPYGTNGTFFLLTSSNLQSGAMKNTD